MSTTFDTELDLDSLVDLDAIVPCRYGDCPTEATFLVVLRCACGCEPKGPFCGPHTEKLHEALKAIEQAYNIPLIGPMLVEGAPACATHNQIALWKEAIPL